MNQMLKKASSVFTAIVCAASITFSGASLVLADGEIDEQTKTTIETTAEGLTNTIIPLTEDEIAVMDGSKCIMQLRGVRPFFSDKFDITKHKQYPLLSDYDKKNEFDIEKYVKNRNRLRFKRNDVVDEVCDVGEITA
mgnify:CR=1 FL=1